MSAKVAACICFKDKNLAGDKSPFVFQGLPGGMGFPGVKGTKGAKVKRDKKHPQSSSFQKKKKKTQYKRVSSLRNPMSDSLHFDLR